VFFKNGIEGFTTSISKRTKLLSEPNLGKGQQGNRSLERLQMSKRGINQLINSSKLSRMGRMKAKERSTFYLPLNLASSIQRFHHQLN